MASQQQFPWSGVVIAIALVALLALSLTSLGFAPYIPGTQAVDNRTIIDKTSLEGNGAVNATFSTRLIANVSNCTVLFQTIVFNNALAPANLTIVRQLEPGSEVTNSTQPHELVPSLDAMVVKWDLQLNASTAKAINYTVKQIFC